VTIGALQRLVDEAAVPASLQRTGLPRAVPDVVARTAHRVTGDALAAVLDATTATVAIEYMPGALVVQVDDDGQPVRDGLDGAADIAAGIGGGLTAAPAPGGFRVRAWLPTEGQPPPRRQR